MPLNFYNTLTKKIEEFVPIEKNRVRFYSCGPTVYDYFHIGNARTFVMCDMLQKYLRFKGYEVTFLMNLTDIDDKIINKAIELKISFNEVTEKYISAFFDDIKKLKIKPADVYPKATENIKYIIELIESLLQKGIAYKIKDDVYFNISKFNEYGKLSAKNLDELIGGARVNLNDDKINQGDFALWKAAKPGEPFWESPFGNGRPGWHIECSAMSMRYFGDTFDIHAGGNDLIFPHHENEIAQSEASTGKQFVKYWIHFGFLNIDNQKMSKSLGNFFTTREILKQFSAESIRLTFAQALYSAPLNFSKEILTASENAIDRINNTYQKFIDKPVEDIQQEEFIIDGYLEEFEKSMDDNFNTPKAVAVFFEFIKDVNTFIHSKESISKTNFEKIKRCFLKLGDEVLGIIPLENDKGIGDEQFEKMMEIFIKLRNELRQRKLYDLADKIRDELKKVNIIMEDAKGKTTWKLK